MNIAANISSITRRSLHDELVERLRTLIVEGTLEPGLKVPERDLCEQFEVSRTPMREALKVLAADGLVTLTPNRGAWVSKLTLPELEEVFPVMGALEALSGELACARISDKQVAAVRKLHDRMVVHYEAGELDAYFAVNQQIHEAILEAADNETLSAQYRSLSTRIRRARYVANMTAERWAQAVDEHEQILNALEARDAGRLANILRQHLSNKFATVKEWLLAQEEPAS
ncbi:MAG: GntR family transcriptional regulator [Alphaproteobacteria bacterium]|nr:GntR family transcriptional regulator [Alphaproteobacteria bacterium]